MLLGGAAVAVDGAVGGAARGSGAVLGGTRKFAAAGGGFLHSCMLASTLIAAGFSVAGGEEDDYGDGDRNAKAENEHDAGASVWPPLWSAGMARSAVVHVGSDFSYKMEVAGETWLGGAGVAVRCGGTRYVSPPSTNLRHVGAPRNDTWVGPVNGTYSDTDCPNVGCHGGATAPLSVKACEALCDEQAGCDAFNFSPTASDGRGGCCLRACPAGKPSGPPHNGACCGYYRSGTPVPGPPAPPAPPFPPPSPSPPPDPPPPPGCNVTNNTAFHGTTMNGGPGVPIVNASECCERCKKTPPCSHWNFIFGQAPGWSLGCQLFTKDGVTGPATRLQNVSSGQCPPAPPALTLEAEGSPVSMQGSSASMGAFTSIAQDWKASSCAKIRTTIRYYPTHDHFEFETHFPDGAAGTAAVELVHQFLGQSTVTSEFPVFFVRNESERGFVHWAGEFLDGTESVNRPPIGWKQGEFVGGTGAGPLVLYSAANDTTLPPALALSVGNHFQSAILSRRVDGAVVAGVQGFVTSIPQNFSLSVGLASRRGVLAAINGLGSSLQAQHQTNRLTLDEDPLDRQLGYVQDDGGY